MGKKSEQAATETHQPELAGGSTRPPVSISVGLDPETEHAVHVASYGLGGPGHKSEVVAGALEEFLAVLARMEESGDPAFHLELRRIHGGVLRAPATVNRTYRIPRHLHEAAVRLCIHHHVTIAGLVRVALARRTW